MAHPDDYLNPSQKDTLAQIAKDLASVLKVAAELEAQRTKILADAKACFSRVGANRP